MARKIGGSKRDVLRGDAGFDYFNGAGGHDLIIAGGGNNRVIGGSGNDKIITGSGRDKITAGSGKDDIRSGAGHDNVNSGSGNDKINAGSGNDKVTAGSGNDVINAGSGNDIISAGSGNNSVNAGSGNDKITAGSGKDVINAGAGNDIISAGSGNNSVTAGSGNDTITAGSGKDVINAGSGNDIIRSGAGNDSINGGAGRDIAVFTGNAGDYTIDVPKVAQLQAGALVTVTNIATGEVNTLSFVETLMFDDGPVLLDAPLLNGISEDLPLGLNPGTLVSDLVSASSLDGAPVKAIAITSFDTANGQWQYRIAGAPDWVAVPAVSDANALLLGGGGAVRFLPDADFSGSATVTYQAWDQTSGTAGTTVDVSVNGSGTAFSTGSETALIDVDPTADAPGLNVKDVGGVEGTPLDIDIATTLNDADGSETLTAIKLTGFPSGATFSLGSLQGTEWIIDDPAQLASLASTQLTMTPPLGFSGGFILTVAAEVTDTATLSTGTTVSTTTVTQTPNITIAATNDAPSGTDNTVTTNEDTAYIFAVTDFGFTDPLDVTSNTLVAVRITTLPSGGMLTDGFNPVTEGEFVGVTSIVAGGLVFTPDPDASGAGHTTLTFQVQDNGGTEDGGVDLDPTPNTLTIDVTPINDLPAGQPVITSPAPAEDTVLTADTSAITDVDGIGAFSFQWETFNGTIGSPIAGANSATFTPGDAEVGQQLRVLVSYTDGDGTVETVVSTPTAAVTNVNDAPTGLPIVSAPAIEGITLTVDTSGIGDADGIGLIDFQWQSSPDGTLWSDILGATGPSFVPDDSEVGQLLRAQVSYTDGHGKVETLTSNETVPVTNTNDLPGGAPTITGSATEDAILTADTSGITDADGLGPFSHQWQSSSDGTVWTDIGGATASTFAPGDSQVGEQLRVRVSYVDGDNTIEILNSAATTPVVNINDAPVVDQGIADQNVDEDAPWSFTVPADAFTDIDGDALTLDASLGDGLVLPAWLAFDNITGTFTGTPPQDFNGAIDLKVIASDPAAETAEFTFTLTVNPVNDAPADLSVLGSTAIALTLGDDIGTLAATDIDGDTLTYSVTDLSSDFEVVGTTLKLKDGASLSSSDNNTAATSVELEVFDGTTATTKTVDVTVVEAAATSFSAASASFASSSTVLDLNGDGFSDLAVRGSTVVSFGSATGLQASSAAAVNGSNGFAVNVDADALSGGDLNGDGIDDLAIGTVADQSVYVVFGSDLGFSANVDATALDGTDGFAVTGLAADLGGGAGTIDLAVGDVNGDSLDDLVVNQVYTANGSDFTSQTYIVYGDDTGFGASIDVSALNSSNGFALINSAEAVVGASLDVSDIDGDDVDDIILGGVTATGNGNIHVVKGKQSFSSTTDIGLLAANEVILISAAITSTLGASVSAVADVTGDGIEDLAATTDVGVFIVDGTTLQASDAIVLAATDVVFTEASGAISSAGDVNSDGISDMFATDASGNTFILYGRSDLLGSGVSLSLVDAAEAGGFAIAGTQGAPIALGDANGDSFGDFAVVNPGGLSLASGADFSGSATFVGTDIDDTFVAGAANDVIIGGRGDDDLSGGAGNDHIRGGAGIDTLNGDDGDDGVEGGAGNDQLFGGTGNDVLLGGHGDDQLDGGPDSDRLEGGPGVDTLLGQAGDDFLFGGGGGDTLRGGSENDLLMGDAGNDQLFGNTGNDVLAGGPGLDSLTGGAGNDRFVFHIGDGPDTITDFDPGPLGPGNVVDQIELKGFDLSFAALDTNGDQQLNPADANITGGPGGITLQFGPNDVLTVDNVGALQPEDLLFT